MQQRTTGGGEREGKMQCRICAGRHRGQQPAYWRPACAWWIDKLPRGKRDDSRYGRNLRNRGLPSNNQGGDEEESSNPSSGGNHTRTATACTIAPVPSSLEKKPAPSTGCLEYTVECLLVKTRKHGRPATNVHNIDNKSMATTKQSSRDTHGQFFQLNKQQGYQPCQATSTPQEHSQGQTEIRSHHAKKRKGGGGEPHRAHASFRKPYANVKNRRGKPVNAASGTQLPLSPPHIQNV